MAIYMRLKNLPVHRSMREISELIYETCKTYLVTQGLMATAKPYSLVVDTRFDSVGRAMTKDIADGGIDAFLTAYLRAQVGDAKGKK